MRSPALARLCAALICAVAAPALAADEAALAARVEQLARELESVKAQLAELQRAQATAAAATTATGTESPSPAIDTPAGNPAPRVEWFGYGELDLSRPAGEAATVDVARFVLGAGVNFDARTRLVTELEIEHAISSAEDAGEVEVEQAYVERDLGAGLAGRAGLMLVPLGLLNENHEPTRYYGVQRNGVETAILPTTWREGGIAVQKRTESGWRWDVGLTTGFDLNHWDASSGDGSQSPLGSIHQEMSLARASHASGFLAVNYTGLPGLRVGAGVFGGSVAQSAALAGNPSLRLWEAHATWQGAGLELAGLYADGHLSGTRATNSALPGLPTPVPESFGGGYLQAAWRAPRSLAPFIRWERYNTGIRYASLAPSPTPAPLPWTTGWVGGVNWNLAPGLVLKADHALYTSGGSPNRFDLGLGYDF